MPAYSGNKVAPASGSVLLLNTGVGVSKDFVLTPEEAPIPVTVLRFKELGWKVADYNRNVLIDSKFAGSMRCSPMVSTRSCMTGVV